MYVTAQPCTTCVKAMATTGIRRVIFDSEYPDELACQLAKEAGMELISFREMLEQTAQAEQTKQTQQDD